MENKFQTSFIPKRSLDETGSVRVKTPHNLLYVTSVFIILAALLASLGVFLYSIFLDKQVETAKKEVIAKEKEFDYQAIENIVDVDNQLKAATTLLKNHTEASSIFELLETNTLKNLRFTSFEFAYLSPTKTALTMKGKARTFGAVARQAELFSTASSTRAYFKSPIFSDLNLDDAGNVTFSFLTTIDSALISYKPDSSAPRQTAPVVETPTASTSSSTL